MRDIIFLFRFKRGPRNDKVIKFLKLASERVVLQLLII